MCGMCVLGSHCFWQWLSFNTVRPIAQLIFLKGVHAVISAVTLHGDELNSLWQNMRSKGHRLWIVTRAPAAYRIFL